MGGVNRQRGNYAFVDAVWALRYTIDDSPHLGCLVYDTSGSAEAQESVVDALVKESIVAAVRGALGRAATLPALDVAGVNIVGDVDLPPGVRESLPAEAKIWDARSAG